MLDCDGPKVYEGDAGRFLEGWDHRPHNRRENRCFILLNMSFSGLPFFYQNTKQSN